MSAKNAIMKAKIENEIVELMLKTSAENVWLDGETTLASKLAQMIASLNNKATQSDISTAISDLINGAPETYDTLKEIADYISTHESVVSGLNAAIGNKVDKVSGKGLSANDFTTALKNKLDGIAAGAEVNQNAFSKVTVGTTDISSTGKTDTLTIVAGSNVTLTPDATNKKVTIAATNTTYSDVKGATSSAAGTHGLVPAPAAGAQNKFLRGDGTWQNPPTVTVDTAMSTTSTNPVQNKVAKAAIDAIPVVTVSGSQPTNMKNGDVWISVL